MILLDENILAGERILLRGWRIHARQIGYDVAAKGVKDDAIIPLLHSLGRTTFFTRDLGLFRRRLIHPAYCLVCLEVDEDDLAKYVRRYLRHPRFATQRKRAGCVVRVSPLGINRMSLNEPDEAVPW